MAKKLNFFGIALIAFIMGGGATLSGTPFFDPADNTVTTQNDFLPSASAQEVETITGLQLHPDEVFREHTYEKQQDGYTWELDENGELYKQWDEDRLGTNTPTKPDYPRLSERSTTFQNPDGTFTMRTHSPYVLNSMGDWIPYILIEDSDIVQIEKAGNMKYVFDKNNCALTILQDGNVIIKSDSYTVRTATIGTDDWTALSVNNEVCTTDIIGNSNFR